MRRILVSALIASAIIASAFSLAYPVPMYSTSTYVSSSVSTAINDMVLLNYSTFLATCGGYPPACYVQIVPYTVTATWSAETTVTQTLFSTSTTHVPVAASGLGGTFVLIFSLTILLVGFALFAKNQFADRRHAPD